MTPMTNPCENTPLRECFFKWYNPSLPCDSPENILAAQIVMKQNGLYHGSLDGIWGRESQDAYDATLKSGLTSPFGECQGTVPNYAPKPSVDQVDVESSDSNTLVVALAAAAVGLLAGAIAWKR